MLVGHIRLKKVGDRASLGTLRGCLSMSVTMWLSAMFSDCAVVENEVIFLIPMPCMNQAKPILKVTCKISI